MARLFFMHAGVINNILEVHDNLFPVILKELEFGYIYTI